jgi:hypothetical protein
MARERLGLSRSELERELNWLLRSPPEDPRQLVKLFSSVLVTLLEKNNARLTEDLRQDTAPDPEEDF